MTELPVATRSRSGFISVWFALDAVFSLFPPVYWLLGGPHPLVLGLPSSVVYYIALGTFITASLLAAYWDDERRGAFEAI
jgi:hypothetical protein